MCPNVAIADEKRGFYGVQFHPEVNHTENGIKILHNFSLRGVQSQGRLDHGGLPEDLRGRPAGKDRGGEGTAGAVGGRGLLGGRRAAG
jgi:hypothetical protein